MMGRTPNLTVAALVLACAPHAQATTLQRMTLEELTATAPYVVRVRCLAAESRFEEGEIWTLTTFEVLETMKGAIPRRITVRLLGGRAGNLVSTVDGVPRFQPGEELFLFLEPASPSAYSVTSWAQGTFRIRRDPATGAEFVTQDTSGLAMFDPATKQFHPGGVRNLPVEEFRQRIRTALEKLRGRRQP
jgi:hypothetical protein